MIRLLAGIGAVALLMPRAINPAPPSITEPAMDGDLCHPADVHMQASGYFDGDGDAHASTDWSIWKVSTSQKVWDAPAKTGFEAVHIHLADGAFVGPYAGRTECEYDTDFRLEVRVRDATGAVSAVSQRLFRSTPAGPPGVAAPIPWIPAEDGYRVEVVATGFQLPVNIAFHPIPPPNPTDPLFYVTELYGQVKVVRKNGTVGTYASGLLNYDPTALGTFPGAGEQGLAGLCVDGVSGDLFATMLYQNAAGTARYPKVARLHSNDGGLTMATNTTLLDMVGETQGQSHQISNCTIGPDAKLYVHMGDGFNYLNSGNLSSYRGKILRMNLDGSPAPGNPPLGPTGYVWAYGVRNPFGGTWRTSDGQHYMVENGPSRDRLARVISGRNFGWNDTDTSMNNLAIYVWNPARAPVNIAFVESGFPAAKLGHAFVTESGPTYALGPQVNGKRIVEFVLASNDAAPVSGPTTFVEYAGTGRATAVALAAGPDGLYFSDLYKDQGAATPAEAGANILRVRYIGLPPVGTGTGFQGTYFDGPNFSGTSVVRTDPTINFSWGAGQPHPSIGADTFSVRWMGQVQPRTSDTFTFYAQTNDGVRLWVNGSLLIDHWMNMASTENAGTIALEAGKKYDVVMEYYDDVTTAVAQLKWSGPAQKKEPIPAAQVYAPDLRDNDGDTVPNTLDLDDDGDGTPDATDPDLDGDGHSNVAEIAAGTDPNDNLSFPVAPPPAAKSDSSSGCGLTGLDALLILAVTALLRRAAKRTV